MKKITTLQTTKVTNLPQIPKNLVEIFNSLPYEQKRTYFQRVHGTVRGTTGFFDYWFHQGLGDFKTFLIDGKEYHVMIKTSGGSYECGTSERSNNIVVHTVDKIGSGGGEEYFNNTSSNKINRPHHEYKTIEKIIEKDGKFIITITNAQQVQKDIIVDGLKTYIFEGDELSKLWTPDYLIPVKYSIKQTLTNTLKTLPKGVSFIEQKQKICNQYIEEAFSQKDLFLIQKYEKIFGYILSYEQQQRLLDIICEDIEKYRKPHHEKVTKYLDKKNELPQRIEYLTKVTDLIYEKLSNKSTLGESISSWNSLSSEVFIINSVKNKDLGSNYLKAIMDHYIEYNISRAAGYIFFPDKYNYKEFQDITGEYKEQKQEIFEKYIAYALEHHNRMSIINEILKLEKDPDITIETKLLQKIVYSILTYRDEKEVSLPNKEIIDNFIDRAYSVGLHKDQLIEDISEWAIALGEENTHEGKDINRFQNNSQLYSLLERNLLSINAIETICNNSINKFPDAIMNYGYPSKVVNEFFEKCNIYLPKPIDYKVVLFEKMMNPEIIAKFNRDTLTSLLYSFIIDNPKLLQHKEWFLEIAAKSDRLSPLFEKARKFNMPSSWYHTRIKKSYDIFLNATENQYDKRKHLCSIIEYAGLSAEKSFIHTLVQDLFKRKMLDAARDIAKVGGIYPIWENAFEKKRAEEALSNNNIRTLIEIEGKKHISKKYVQEVIQREYLNILDGKESIGQVDSYNGSERFKTLLEYAEQYNIDLMTLLSK